MESAWYNRYLESQTDAILKKGKVFVLYGPRRVGKTELIRKMIAGFNGKIFAGTGDNQEVRELLSAQKFSQLQTAFGSYQLLFIDEAQRIPEVGYALKLLIDHFPEMIILVTGSSSFDLSNKIGEPLTGRNTQPVSHFSFGTLPTVWRNVCAAKTGRFADLRSLSRCFKCFIG
jgi:predicted AAA+ superfamily ATPase